jgi:hypothetical protein
MSIVKALRIRAPSAFYKKPQIKEKDICKSFFESYRIQKHYYGLKSFIFHVPNEQKCNIAYTIGLKKMGLTAGIADYTILLPSGKVAFLEFKRGPNGKLSPAQESFKQICISLNIP